MTYRISWRIDGKRNHFSHLRLRLSCAQGVPAALAIAAAAGSGRASHLASIREPSVDVKGGGRTLPRPGLSRKDARPSVDTVRGKPCPDEGLTCDPPARTVPDRLRSELGSERREGGFRFGQPPTGAARLSGKP